MNIFVISGSLRIASSNTALLRCLAERAPASVTIEIFRELERIPPFNPDDENKPPPETVVNWRTRLKEADALIFSTPEYAHGDRKSTRLNSSHQIISYAVFCLKKKKNIR